MNRIYRKVWNKSLGQMVVASELASGDGTRTGGAEAGIRRNVLALAVLMLLGVAGSAWAADAVCVDPVTGLPNGTTSGAGDEVACGQGASASGDNAVALGPDAIASGATSLAFGQGSSATVADGVALGAGSVAETAAGIAGYVPVNADAAHASAIVATTGTLGAVSVGDAANGQFRQITGVAAGTEDSDAVNVAQLVSAQEAATTHYFSVNDNGVVQGNYDNDGATGINALAAGVNAEAVGNETVAVGANAYANGTAAIAIGQNSDATGIGAMAAGNNAVAFGVNSVATGSSAVASGNHAIAVGGDASATSSGAVAIGRLTTATAVAAIAVGEGANALGIASVAIGLRSEATTRAVALGSFATASGVNSLAFGSTASATHAGAVALGANSVTAAPNPTAGIILNGTAYTFAGTAPASVVSVGDAGAERQITNVAAGRISDTSTDAINGSQLHATNQAIEDVAGQLTHYYSVNDNGVVQGNYDNDGAIGTNAVAVGTNASAVGGNTVAVGNGATAGDGINPWMGAIAVGNGAIASHQSTVAIGDGAAANQLAAVAIGRDALADRGNSTAVGDMASATGFGGTTVGFQSRAVGDYTAAFGGGAQAVGSHGVAIGNSAIAGGVRATAVGAWAEAHGDNSLALGGFGEGNAQTVAIAANSVALGSGSIADTAAGVAGYDPLTGLPSTDTSSTWVSTLGAVSVGGNGETRQITNVAAGTEDTDAVNVSQLRAVEGLATAGWNVTDADGNTANIGPNGEVRFESGNSNIAVTQTGADDEGVVDITLSNDLDLTADGSVTIGDTLVDNAGVAVGTDVMLGNTGLTVIGGTTTTVVNGDGLTTGTVVVSGVSNDVTGLSNLDLDAADFATVGRAATEEQLELVRGEIGDEIEANRTRYYSVNSTGGGNEDNDGATGEDAIAAGKDAEAEGDGAVAIGYGTTAAGDGSAALGAGAQALELNSLAIGAGAVANHANSIALGAGSATTVGAQASYEGAYVGTSSSTGEMNIGGRQITGVAAGSADTDAVNVSQLQGGVEHAITVSNEYTDIQIGEVNVRIDELDNRVTVIEGDIIDIRGDITNIQADIVDIQGDITNLDNRVTTVEGDIANLTVTVNEFDNRITNVENGADGMFQVSQEGPIVKPMPTGTNSSAGGNGAAASGDNALAVGNQSSASGNNSTAIGTGATASAENSTAIGQGATASHANSVALGQGSATTVGAQTGYNAAYVGSSNSTGEVNMGGRTITGVAPGIAGTDAVNVSQLNAGVNHAINIANQYTDNRINELQNDVWTMDRGYRGATASAMAMAGLPQAYLPGKSMLAVGVGGYQNEFGMAVGLSGITENGRYVYKVQASGNTVRDWGFSVGAGIQW